MPGNLAELRPLIFAAAFVGVAVLLVGWMVAETPTLFVGVDPGDSAIVEGSTSPLSLLAWNETYILNITDTFEYLIEIGAWDVRVEKWDSTKSFYMETYNYWSIFNWNMDPFYWYKDNVDVTHDYGYPTPSRERIDISQLDADFAANKTLEYKAKNTRTEFSVTFGFNSTKYDEPHDAYDGDEMQMIFGVAWDERDSNVNAIGFISGLFTFSLPGVPIYVSALIWVMLFPPLAYLTFIFVIKVIGAVFGGG